MSNTKITKLTLTAFALSLFFNSANAEEDECQLSKHHLVELNMQGGATLTEFGASTSDADANGVFRINWYHKNAGSDCFDYQFRGSFEGLTQEAPGATGFETTQALTMNSTLFFPLVKRNASEREEGSFNFLEKYEWEFGPAATIGLGYSLDNHDAILGGYAGARFSLTPIEKNKKKNSYKFRSISPDHYLDIMAGDTENLSGDVRVNIELRFTVLRLGDDPYNQTRVYGFAQANAGEGDDDFMTFGALVDIPLTNFGKLLGIDSD